ncbi:hypothetical protein ABPG72_018006 [Tetrahymena utriculariae]
MDSNQYMIEGGQSYGQFITDEKTQKQLFIKIFKNKYEYEHEKKIYQNLNQIQEQEDLKILRMLYFDDNNFKIVLPFIRRQLVAYRFQGSGEQKGMKQMIALYHFTQVAQIVKKLHGQKYCHCDIKPSNIVFEIIEEKKLLIDYLIDFGHCQQINQNELSTLACGTEQFNPYELKLNKLNKFKEYSPYALDLYQLGMLLLNLIFFYPISDKNKLLIQEKKKDQFLIVITNKYQNNHEGKFKLNLIPEIYNLIWDLLTGEIKHAHEIFEHNVFQLPEVTKILKCLESIENLNKTLNEEYLTLDYMQIIKTKEQNGNRGNSILNFEKGLEELILQNCDKYQQFQQQYKNFCIRKPRKVKDSYLYSNSLFFQMQAPQIVENLLYILGKDDESIFSQDIFLENEKMILQISTKYRFKEVIYEENENNQTQNYKTRDEVKDVTMQIEIVAVEEQYNQDLKSILFTNLNDKKEQEDESIYFFNLTQQIQQKLKNMSD